MSVLAFCMEKKHTNGQQDEAENGCLLLLGNYTNALAVAASSHHHICLDHGLKKEVNIEHIISVADHKKSATVKKSY